jgi:hypothetical protein
MNFTNEDFWDALADALRAAGGITNLARILGLPVRTVQNWKYNIRKPSALVRRFLIPAFKQICADAKKPAN